MPLQLRPAVEADHKVIGVVSRDAFRDYSVTTAIFPPHLYHKSETGDPALDEAVWRADRSAKRARDGRPTFVVVDVPEDGRGPEKIVGFAQWEVPLPAEANTPGPAPGDLFKADSVPAPGCLDEACLHVLYEQLEGEVEKALGPEGHSKMWYLMSVAIDPAQQRRGIGRMLVQHGLDLATKDGRDAFLFATPAGRGLYESLGFRHLGDGFDLMGTVHYAMLWQRPGSNEQSQV